METVTNRFGEKQTSWKSHKHPENDKFMQVVKYMHVEKLDKSTMLYWSLCNASSNDNHFIANITLEDALSLYTDEEIKEVSEDEFQQWLTKKL